MLLNKRGSVVFMDTFQGQGGGGGGGGGRGYHS